MGSEVAVQVVRVLYQQVLIGFQLFPKSKDLSMDDVQLRIYVYRLLRNLRLDRLQFVGGSELLELPLVVLEILFVGDQFLEESVPGLLLLDGRIRYPLELL